MANELRYTLDTSKEIYTDRKCKQLDDRTAIITLLDKGQAFNVTGASITLNAKKPDNTWVNQTTGITIASNVVTIALSRDITRAPGIVELELLIVLASKNTTTFTFKLQVQGSVIQNGDLQSKNSITEIEKLNNTITSATNTVNAIINNINAVKKSLEADLSNGNTTQMRTEIDTLTGSITNPNLIPNGNFENGTKFNYWGFSEWRDKGLVTLGWNWTSTTANFSLGDYTPYMRALNVANSETGGVISSYITVKPNTIYTLSYYRSLWRGKATHEHAFFSGTASLGALLTTNGVTVTDEANRLTKGTVWDDCNGNEPTVNSSIWKKVTMTFTTPSTCDNIKLTFALQYSYADAFFFLGKVKLEEGQLDTPYCEGMQPIIDVTLTTNNKYIVGAINEIDGQLGDVSALTTTAKTGVGAINELDGQVGNVAGMTTTNKIVANAVNELDSCKTEDSTLVGMVVYFARNTPPTGFLKCNGATVSRTTYARLFSAIGTIFGVGDGSTTFALPDLRGEFIKGWDDGRGIDVGRTFGSWKGDGAKISKTEVAGYGLAAGTVGFSDRVYVTGEGNTGHPRNVALLACIKY